MLVLIFLNILFIRKVILKMLMRQNKYSNYEKNIVIAKFSHLLMMLCFEMSKRQHPHLRLRQKMKQKIYKSNPENIKTYRPLPPGPVTPTISL